MSAPHQNRETESQPGPPLVHFFVSMASSQFNGNIWKSINGCSNGQRDADSSMYEWAQIHYSFHSLISSPPLMHPSGSIYIPSIGSEGSSWGVSKPMEGQ